MNWRAITTNETAFNSRKLIITLVLGTTALLASCRQQGSEMHFFMENKTAAEQLEGMRALPLEMKYKIFRYGNDEMHPPMLYLADAIANQGEAAMPFMLMQMERATDTQAIRDNLLIFETMARKNLYVFKRSAHALNIIENAWERIKDRDWKYSTCLEMLKAIKAN